MFISYWNKEDCVFDEIEARIIDKNNELFINNLLKKEGAQLSTIEIETINRCNNDCSFCPANKNRDIRHLQKMDEKLFKKIIDELSEMDYRGRVSLYSNDEPLLDKRILEFVAYAREKLPKAYHSLFTNGILLTEEIYSFLVEKLDYLRINNYNDDLQLNENIKSIYEKGLAENKCLVEVEVRRKTQVLQNRGGLSPNNNARMSFNSACILPFIQMVIRPDGSVSRCCQDVYGNETLGNVRDNSIKDVFEGEKYQLYRESMLNGGRCSLPFCGMCDLIGLINRYPKDWEYAYYCVMIEHLVSISNNGRRIAICCVNQAEKIMNDLFMNGIADVTVSYLERDLEFFLKRGDFVVWGENAKTAQSVLRKYSKELLEDIIIYNRDISDYVRYSSNQERDDERREIILAEEKKRLVIFGAGNTAKRIVNSLGLERYYIVDNKKAGELFDSNVFIESPNKIQEVENPLVLVAAFDVNAIVKQLNEMGIGSNDIRFGYKILR